MEEIVTKIRKWGNSYGVLLPKLVIDNQQLKEDSEVKISVRLHKKLTVNDLFELSKKHPLKTRKNTEEIMKEMDYELYGIRK